MDNFASFCTKTCLPSSRTKYLIKRLAKLMTLSHILDFLGHPMLTYYFWRRHKTNGGTAADIFMSWPVIVTSYLYSRWWSLLHLVYNTGTYGYFYVGYDIYIMEHLDCWKPAYIAESVFYAIIVLYKLFGKGKDDCRRAKDFPSVPALAYSRSGVSRSSSLSSASVRTPASSAAGTDW
eukprot:CAMPEP_0176166298 /NCGR_PEP_ID=MMETSP0120_2-20121206/85050_1 /TAXON_ID=160619 /ORGANISM="Kryptoperidinium foliaceum, Strain CCMP 1326" /LENGTH=177 /DNA_ID=CAMNT_0017503833 /DNA_START=98 /DNA_END=628 /DNA_ORIENTATION=-